MLYVIVEWCLSMCSYVLFALAELWLWITIIEGTLLHIVRIHPCVSLASPQSINVSTMCCPCSGRF